MHLIVIKKMQKTLFTFEVISHLIFSIMTPIHVFRARARHSLRTKSNNTFENSNMAVFGIGHTKMSEFW